MKKYVLSAVVTGLLVPSVYAMDGGAAPAVEVEIPAVEVEVTAEEVSVVEVEVATEDIPGDVVDDMKVEEVEFRTLEVAVENEELKPEVCVDPAVDGVEVSVEGFPVDENGEPLMVICTFGGELPVEGEVAVEGEVDPSLVDLASQSGVAVDENGEPLVMYTFGGVADGGERPLESAGPVEGESVDSTGGVEITSSEESPIRNHGEIQPNFRGGIADRGAEALAASSTGGDTEAPSPQLLNDEQRGAVRGLRNEEEPSKPRSGMGKLFAKFRKPKAEVTLASATSTDKALPSQLAEVDRLRDTALRTGDQKMLAKADKLEKELRAKAGKVTKIPTRTK